MMKKLLILILMAVIISGCTTTSEVRVLPPTSVEPYIDSKLLEKCKRPIKVPERALAQLEIEEYWMIDRKNLIICGDRNKALGDAIENRLKQKEKNKG